MFVDSHLHNVVVTVVDRISLDAREAGFLRQMCRFCIDERMPGSLACKQLIEVLDAANVPERPEEPVYGLFERPSRAPGWIKP